MRTIRYAEYSDHVLSLNKLEERMLERSLRSIEISRKACLSLLNREIRALEEDFDLRQLRLASASNQTRQRNIARANQLLKRNYSANLNRLNAFDLNKATPSPQPPPSRLSSAAEVTVAANLNRGNKSNSKKNLSASARLSNASAKPMLDSRLGYLKIFILFKSVFN